LFQYRSSTSCVSSTQLNSTQPPTSTLQKGVLRVSRQTETQVWLRSRSISLPSEVWSSRHALSHRVESTTHGSSDLDLEGKKDFPESATVVDVDCLLVASLVVITLLIVSSAFVSGVEDASTRDISRAEVVLGDRQEER